MRLRPALVSALLLVFCGVALSGTAEELPTDLERMLLPITAVDLAGGYGTTWSTELWLRMPRGVVFVAPVFAPSACDPPCPDPLGIGSGSFQSGFFRTHAGESGGQLLYVDRQHINDVSISLRLIAKSPAISNAPLQLPVVRERNFKTSTVDILGIPILAKNRYMLRVYAIDPAQAGAVRIMIFSEDPQTSEMLIFDRNASLEVSQRTYVVGGTTFLLRPPMTALDLTPLVPTGFQSVRVEITPLTPALAIWGFVSITDNVSQSVTLRTP